ncbi:MAG: DUF916 domain-containing protein [Microbacterium sp.]
MNLSPPLRRHAGIRLLCTLLAVVATLLVAPAAHADDTDDTDVTWTVRTDSNSFGADRTNYSYTLDAGGTLHDGIVVANRGTTDLELTVYAADGFTSDDGELSLRLADEQSTGVGAWITADTTEVTVPAGGTVTVPFTVSIPDNATPGDYAGGVVTSLTDADSSSTVSVERRLGIRVNLRVGGELAPSLAVEDLSVGWNGGVNPFAGGDATVTYTLHNTGNATISAVPTEQVSGIFGWFPYTADASDTTPQLLPGESRTFSTTVTGVPALLLLLGSVSITPLVTDASGSTSPIDAVNATALGVAVPWTSLLLLLLVAAAAFGYLRNRRRRRAIDARDAEARVSEAVEKALEEERAKLLVEAGERG